VPVALGQRAAGVVIAAALSTVSVAAQSPAPTALRPPSAELDEGFSRIGWVRELADGRLIVVDQFERRLVVVDFRTGAVRDIARAGQGPGEVRIIYGLVALGGDSTLVEDRQARRWLIFDGERAVATVISAPRAPVPALAGADGRGRLLDIQGFAFRRSPGVPYTPMRVNAESVLVLVRYRERGGRGADPGAPGRLASRIDTIARLRGAGRGQTLVWRSAPPPASWWLLENPLAAEEQALLFQDGWIALAFADPYRVEWVTPEGSRVRAAPMAETPVAVDDRVRRALIAWRWPKVTPPFTSDQLPPWPATLPPFLNDALLAAPDGRLVIRRTYNPFAPATSYDIVDRKGTLSGRLVLKANERLVGFGARSAYVVAKDENDVEWLRRHPWP